MRSIIGLFSNVFVGVGQMFPNTWSFIPQVLVFLVPLFGRIVPYIRSRNSEHSPFFVFSQFPLFFCYPCICIFEFLPVQACAYLYTQLFRHWNVCIPASLYIDLSVYVGIRESKCVHIPQYLYMQIPVDMQIPEYATLLISLYFT